MNRKPIIIVPGEPNSIFLEIYLKIIKKNTIKSPIILICSQTLLTLQMKKLRFNYKINIVEQNNILSQLKKKEINLLNVNYNPKKAFEKISSKSNVYIENCFRIALKLLKKNITNKFINGPISKKYFLKKKYLGVAEYLSKKTNTTKFAMLIYNQNLSVSPITTHLPIKLVSKKINKKIIINKIKLINNFYKKILKTKPQIGVTGLNPH